MCIVEVVVTWGPLAACPGHDSRPQEITIHPSGSAEAGPAPIPSLLSLCFQPHQPSFSSWKVASSFLPQGLCTGFTLLSPPSVIPLSISWLFSSQIKPHCLREASNSLLLPGKIPFVEVHLEAVSSPSQRSPVPTKILISVIASVSSTH